MDRQNISPITHSYSNELNSLTHFFRGWVGVELVIFKHWKYLLNNFLYRKCFYFSISIYINDIFPGLLVYLIVYFVILWDSHRFLFLARRRKFLKNPVRLFLKVFYNYSSCFWQGWVFKRFRFLFKKYKHNQYIEMSFDLGKTNPFYCLDSFGNFFN